MKTNFDKMRELNKSILEDAEIKQLLKMKTELLNNMKPNYLVNKETNIMQELKSDIEKAMLEKIDLLVQNRTEQIKKHYA
jgi:hypothetical protein